MAKALKTAAVIVGAVALIATGVGAVAGVGTLVAGVSVGTIAAVAGVGAAVLTYAAKALTKAPPTTISGNQTQFTANIDQGIPKGLGRTAISGFIVHQQTWDWSGSTPPNAFRTFFGVWSHGRSKLTGATFQVDGADVTFGGGGDNDIAQGGYNDGSNNGWMWLRAQDGTQTDALKATGFYPYPAGWSADAKMSGYSDFSWTLKFDESGKTYPGGAVPQPRRIDDWGPVYDPRQDSTFPGGSGPCRVNQPATYVFDGIDPAKPANRNPWLQALTWALGHWDNGKRVMGIGFAAASILMADYVAAANIADANGWTIGGVVYSTDGKWDALKKMCAAGGGEPLQLGGALSCNVSTPRVSLATIGDDDIIAQPTIPGGPRIRDKLNGIIPTYRSADHDWQLVPATLVQVASYLAADGRPKTQPVTYELVPDVNQVAELAAYQICDSREIDGIVLPLKLRWIGYKSNDAVTVSSPLTGMSGQLVTIRKRNLDPATGAVTFTCRTETTDKHAFALGRTTTPPPSPALQTVDRAELLQPGISASWSAVADDDGKRPADGATRVRAVGAWSSSAAYSKGDVVTSGGSSYIAVQDVPAGTAITNGAYWQVFATGGVQGVPGRDGRDGTNGTNGTSAYFYVAYADAADGSSGFSFSAGSHRYIGVYIGTTPGAPGSYGAYTWSRLTGNDGVNGTNGTPGPIGPDGRQSYVHFAYADSADGSSNFTTGDPGSRKYIGVYADYSEPDSNSYGDYAWSLIKGQDGAPGTPGANGAAGPVGPPGAPGAPGTQGPPGQAQFVAVSVNGEGTYNLGTAIVSSGQTYQAQARVRLLGGGEGTLEVDLEYSFNGGGWNVMSNGTAYGSSGSEPTPAVIGPPGSYASATAPGDGPMSFRAVVGAGGSYTGVSGYAGVLVG